MKKKRPSVNLAQQAEPARQNKWISQWPKFLLLLILAATASIYAGSLKNSFTSYDDMDYILSNPNVQQLSAKTLGVIFSSFFMSNYHPLTTLIWAICFKFYAGQPFIYHLTGLIFHLLNILLVFVFFKKLSGSTYIPLFVAAIFAVHPLNVESVAWISELKNVLFTFFFLLSAISYLKYSKDGFKKKHLVFATLFFIGSLLSKSAAVMLPLSLVAIDIFLARKDYRKMIIEKIPFLLLSLVFGIMAIASQHEVFTNSFTPHFAFASRILFAFYGILYYVVMLFAPVHLSAVHFFPSTAAPLPLIYYIAAPATLVLVAALLLIKKHRRMIVFGLFFYIANLAMVLQLLPFGKAIVAERYAYVPMLGILFIVAYLLNQLRKKFAENKIAYAVLFWIIPAGAFVAFSILTQQRTKVWKDSSSLFADVVAKYPDRAYAHYALGNSKNSANDLQGALQCYSRAASLEPYADVYNNRGWIYYALQNYQAAIDDFDRAIELDTTNSQFFFGRGMTYMALMKHELAGVDFVKAASITPGYVDALTNAAYCAYSRNKMAEAIAWYQTAYFYAPGSATIPFNLGLIYKGVGAKDQACNYIGIAASKGSVPAQQTQNEYCK